MELLGRAVGDFLSSHRQPLGLERDDGLLVEVPPACFIDESSGPHEEELLKRARGDVLDAGCGTGRLALRLQAAGLRVVGIDIAPALVAIARARGLREAHVASVWDDLGGPWDTVLLGGNNIGLAGSLSGAARLLRHLGGALRPQGVILVTSLDVAATTEPVHLAYHQANLRAGRDRGAVRMRVAYGDERGPWFDWLHVAPAELAQAAAGAGLAVEVISQIAGGGYGAVVRGPDGASSAA